MDQPLIEHECCDCDLIWTDYLDYGTCPECGSSNVTHSDDDDDD